MLYQTIKLIFIFILLIGCAINKPTEQKSTALKKEAQIANHGSKECFDNLLNCYEVVLPGDYFLKADGLYKLSNSQYLKQNSIENIAYDTLNDISTYEGPDKLYVNATQDNEHESFYTKIYIASKHDKTMKTFESECFGDKKYIKVRGEIYEWCVSGSSNIEQNDQIISIEDNKNLPVKDYLAFIPSKTSSYQKKVLAINNSEIIDFDPIKLQNIEGIFSPKCALAYEGYARIFKYKTLEKDCSDDNFSFWSKATGELYFDSATIFNSKDIQNISKSCTDIKMKSIHEFCKYQKILPANKEFHSAIGGTEVTLDQILHLADNDESIFGYLRLSEKKKTKELNKKYRHLFTEDLIKTVEKAEYEQAQKDCEGDYSQGVCGLNFSPLLCTQDTNEEYVYKTTQHLKNYAEIQYTWPHIKKPIATYRLLLNKNHRWVIDGIKCNSGNDFNFNE